jgi:hypothetical protein
MAKRSGLSKSTVGRVWTAFNLKPHASRRSSFPPTRFSWRKSTMSTGGCPAVRTGPGDASAPPGVGRPGAHVDGPGNPGRPRRRPRLRRR